MTSFELDLDDTAVKERLRDLKGDYEDNPVWVVGTNVEYAVYLEFGTRDMPPYPFFRPAVRELEANSEAFINKHTNSAIDEIGSTDEMVKTVALALERAITQNANAAAPDRSPGTHPDHPQIDTGTLVNSIQAERIK